MADKLTVRTMAVAQMDTALEWAAREGWNPGLRDAACFYAADPGGFLMGVVEGEPVGCVSGVAYCDGFGFIGLYIVTEEHRGKGYGLRMWRDVMGRLGGRNIGLDGVPAQQGNYRRSGFSTAYRNVRYQTQGGGDVPPGVQPIGEMPFDQVLAYDTRVFAAPRGNFLHRWLHEPGAVAYAASEDRGLAGYGVMRPCRQGFKIGPLFATDEATAEALLQALLAHAPQAPVFLDTPEVNQAAMRLAQRYGMAPVFETARMYTQGDPGVAVEEVFGVTTFELG